MHGPQSETRVVCLIWVQKCMDLAHFIRLELELLRHRSFVTELEELITSHYGNFAILGKGRWSLPKEQAVPIEWQTGPPVPVVSGWDDERVSRVEHHPEAGIEPVSTGMNVPQYCSYAAWRVSKALLRIPTRTNWDRPWAP